MQQYNGNNRTKRQLASALKALLKKKPLSKITIRELTDACMIKRQSFYYHFSDIYELLQFTMIQEVLDFKAAHKDADLGLVISSFIFYADQNRDSFVHLLSPEIDHQAASFVDQFSYEISDWAFQLYANSDFLTANDPQYLKFLKEYFHAIFQELLLSRARGRLDITPEELAQYFVRAIRNQIVGATFAAVSEDVPAPEKCLAK